MKPLLITVGEPAGVGPDCVLRLHAEHPEVFSQCVIAAPAIWLKERAQILGLHTQIDEISSFSDRRRNSQALACWNPLPDDTTIAPVTVAEPSSNTAVAVVACIRAAAMACIQGTASGMVTGPIEKAVLKNSGFNFPGHTEFLAHLANDAPFAMMLASDKLRVALLTTHMALAEVAKSLSIEATVQCIQIIHHDLVTRFGIASPHIGLCALNPHAGEQGHFGDEETRILKPAADIARNSGIHISDPLPADTVFSAPKRGDFDAIICCYHDQGLIPIKALSFGEAVNITLGLPFIRTSVDHGTALDRAGSSKVSYSSLEAAIHMASDMSHRQQCRDEQTKA